jgi:D-alanine transaminase
MVPTMGTPSRPTYAWLDGTLIPFREAHVPLDDRGLQFGESLYEVLAITAGQPRLLVEHVNRITRAAAELDLSEGVPELATWERLVTELSAAENAPEAVLYAQLTGGSAPRRHLADPAPRPTFFAYVTPFRFPRAPDVARGIAAVTLADTRWHRRDLKTTMLLPAVLAKKEAARHGAQEAFFMGPDGELNEGASSNVYLVEGRTLVTPGQSFRLLPGTTRALVDAVASEAGLVVKRERVLPERLFAAEEVFITSTTQFVMPVVSIDGKAVGAGTTGPVATDLATRIRRRYALE